MQLAMNVLIAFLIVVIVSIGPSVMTASFREFYGHRHSFWIVYKDYVLRSAIGAPIAWLVLFLHQHLTWIW